MSAEKRVIFGQLGRLKPEKIEEYEALHAAPWPEVLQTIHDCNLRNYSIFREGAQVFAYFEYIGDDYEADMEKNGAGRGDAALVDAHKAMLPKILCPRRQRILCGYEADFLLCLNHKKCTGGQRTAPVHFQECGKSKWTDQSACLCKTVPRPPLHSGSDAWTRPTRRAHIPPAAIPRDIRRDDADSLHRAQTVRQDLLDDPLRVLFQLIEPPRPGQQIPHDQ